MKDELWMRSWNEGHPQFSADLHRGLVWLFAPVRRLGDAIMRPGIGGAQPRKAR